ncbi:MAG: Gfo/Idh/MocA family protein [Sarcina sp.]
MNKIKFGIIGTSLITEKFLEASSFHRDFELTSIYSRDINKAKDFCFKFGAKFFFDDLEEFAKSEEFDAVYIASPNAFHYPQAITLLKNGKHVLCEKSLGSNEKEVVEMFKTAKENNVLLMEAMIITCLPNFLVIKEALNEIQPIRKVFFNFCQYSSRYDRFKNGIIENAFKPEMATGAISDIGVYCVHPIINLFSLPLDIKSETTLLSTKTDGSGSAIFSYAGMDACIQYSKISNSFIPSEISGEKGSIIIDSMHFNDVKIIYNDKSTKILTIRNEKPNMYFELNEFINTIHLRKIESSLNPPINSINAIKVIDTIRKQGNIIYTAD